MPTTPLAILVHGGAGNIPPERHEDSRRGCETAARRGWALLEKGGSALDAVEAAIRFMEDDPNFNAGRGACLTSAGTVELDASIMDGTSLKAGGVAALRGYAAPIAIARRVLDRSPHDLLAGPGAEAFARAQGFVTVPDDALITERQRRLYEELLAENASPGVMPGDTVGALALDGRGRMAAGLSTGGRRFKLPGRVGDSALPGAGLFAHDAFGAAAATGVGEHIMRVGLALRAIYLLENGHDAQTAAEGAIALLDTWLSDGQAGLIVLTADGRVGMAHSTKCLAHAYRTSGMATVMSAIVHPR